MKPLATGNKVKITLKNKTQEGIVMPGSTDKAIILKLPNGYNITIKLKDAKVKKLGTVKLSTLPKYKPKTNPKLPNISLITTGGTITSRVDYKTGAVYPLEKPEELVLSVPELASIVNIKKIVQPFALTSEDLTPDDWKVIAKEVAKELNDPDISGVIVTHGTDTLHYTASALSFMLKNLNKPVALVGGQRSSDRGSFDGAMNLICAAHYCKSNIAEVATVMHGEEADTYCLAIRGTKSRKFHTTRRDAFRPINQLPLAKITKKGTLTILNKDYVKRHDKGEVKADTKFEKKIALVKFYPGADPGILDYYAEKNYKGIIIEATGMGHVATQPLKKRNSWLPAIKRAIRDGIFVGITSQCLYGRTNPNVYSNLRMLADTGAVHLEDMLPEVAYIKLGRTLANAQTMSEAEELMLTNIAGELTPKITNKAFLY